MATIPKARDKESQRIRQANRAAAVGRLLLGQCDSWHDFLMADTIDLESLPRRKLRSGVVDIKTRLDAEIKKFCTKNFLYMDERKLSLLYEKIKALRGLEMPLSEFEKDFSSINPSVLKGRPRHLTVCISLWGLQFRFPEEMLSNDLLRSLDMAQQCRTTLQKHESKPHAQLLKLRAEIAENIGQRDFAVKAAISNCFNLLEAYLNGIAWDYVQQCNDDELSNRTRKLLEDNPSATIRDKLIKYPEKIAGNPLWTDHDPDIKEFLEIVKPFRDSIMHPSPFMAPQQFGGYDKLRHFYSADYATAVRSAILLVSLIKRIHTHLAANQMLPTWLSDLDASLQTIAQSPGGAQKADPP